MKVTVAFSANDGQTKKEVKETIPLTITSKKNWDSSNKQVQDLYDKNFKT